MKIKHLLKKSLKFLGTEGIIFGIHRAALYEIPLMLVIILTIGYFTGNENRYMDVHPHPFWIIILLISVQYGTNEALLSVFICSFALFFYNVPEQEISQTTYDYIITLTIRPFLWIGESVIIGELMNRHLVQKHELAKKLDIAEVETETITEAYKRLKNLKENLENRLASELSSSITIYEAAKSLESLSQSRILLAVEDIIIASMNPEKFSLYALGESGFEPVTSHGWEEEDNYTLRFPKDTEFYHAIVKEKRVFCVINQKDENILKDKGMIVGPLIDHSTGQIFGMLKIEDLGFMDLTMRNIETFRILCEWIGMAYTNAGKFRSAESNSITNRTNGLLTHNLYKLQVNHLIKIAEQYQFNITETVVIIENEKKLDNEDLTNVIIKMTEIIQENIKDVDQIFDERKLSSGYKILMPTTSLNEAEKKLIKIKEAFKKWIKESKSEAKLSFSTKNDI